MLDPASCEHPEYYRASRMGHLYCIGCRRDLGEDGRPTYFIHSGGELVERHADELPDAVLTGERDDLTERARLGALAELRCEVHELPGGRKVVAKIADADEFARRARMRRQEPDPDAAADGRRNGDL